ncbi:MAG: MFS transporter [Sorangiineae bacterium]|nr:MFS transporter [Polyangiaceae bacterium]MEB2323835.1 MFS transporter [Sorangiineae bacterium]
MTTALAPGRPARFAALRNRDCSLYLGGGALAMMADNIEHVITYWVLWEKFRSPGLVAFEVISHWTPYLLGSVHAGALADRYDCRRVIQVAQLMFMAVSLGWAIAFATGALSIPLACALLVVHGLAGALWSPAEQLMLQDFVGREELESAVRLNATARSLGILFGPVVGSALLLGLGATASMFVNIAIYLPLTGLLAVTKYTGHTREGLTPRVRLTFRAAGRVIRETARDRSLMAMVVLGGLGSFFIGAALQSVMPIFAEDLGAGSKGITYGLLLFAAGAGGVVGGLALELFRFLEPTVSAAVLSTLVYGGSIGIFALTSSYPLAVAMLFIGGVANLAAMSISQTVVQLMAPSDRRGQVIGVYNMSANGLRIGSGFTVGLMAGVVGAHRALGMSSAALCAGTLILVAVIWRGRRRAGELRA